MPLPKSKATKGDRWAALFQAEIAQKETPFPNGSVSVSQIMEMRKRAGVPSSEKVTLVWLQGEKKAGRVKMITGRAIVNGRVNNAVRYVLA
jgi:hypothetical protein